EQDGTTKENAALRDALATKDKHIDALVLQLHQQPLKVQVEQPAPVAPKSTYKSARMSVKYGKPLRPLNDDEVVNVDDDGKFSFGPLTITNVGQTLTRSAVVVHLIFTTEVGWSGWLMNGWTNTPMQTGWS